MSTAELFQVWETLLVIDKVPSEPVLPEKEPKIKIKLPAGTASVSVIVGEVVEGLLAEVPRLVTRANVGVTLLLAALAGPVPVALVAVTVKVYAVPVVSPVTVIGEDEPVAVMPPGLEVTV
jgi:hypothetical protein